MKLTMDAPRRTGAFKLFGGSVLRAVRSTLLIGAVALVIATIRHGGFEWVKMGRLAAANRALFVMLFLALVVWDYWWQRRRWQDRALSRFSDRP